MSFHGLALRSVNCFGVLVKEAHGWFAYFCTKADASVQESWKRWQTA